LQWYRCNTSGANSVELQLFSGRTIDVPSCFIAGKADWGIYQRPGGDMIKMRNDVLTDMRGCHLVDGAGHWVQQEQPEKAGAILLDFLGSQA
jgi:pimeloyl-ACP methyl ester carboxylesterase